MVVAEEKTVSEYLGAVVADGVAQTAVLGGLRLSVSVPRTAADQP